ncbi:MAG: type II toxin-antitoxin system Phd/YefM family antitoxin [Clostridiales bacterium]|jgi:antitoxin Phd|nr:type II toxin-antitoxin system Phd/YefM family antitoxin [Clostridiales bacterium]
MIISTNQILTVTEANQNFSKAARLAEKNGSAVIFKNNRPKYMLLDLSQNAIVDLTDDEKIDVAARRVLERYRAAFEELAK